MSQNLSSAAVVIGALRVKNALNYLYISKKPEKNTLDFFSKFR